MSTAHQLVREGLEMAKFCVNGYLQDLTDEDLLKRPCEGANHIAWQLGHLISSEHQLINMVCPDSMPALPEGFTDSYTKETAGNDNAADFLKKDEYLALLNEQHEGMLAALGKLSDEDMAKESPEQIRDYAPSVGSTFNLIPSHLLMHSGQWVILRRQMGREAMF